MGRHVSASSRYSREFYIFKLKFLVNKLLLKALAFLSSASLLSAADGVSPSPYKLTEIFGLPVTNSILTTWGNLASSHISGSVFGGHPEISPRKGASCY